jgi:hypothetical protein
MLKSIQSNNSPGHSHNRLPSVVDLSVDSCPGILLKRNNKMNLKFKKHPIASVKGADIVNNGAEAYLTDSFLFKGRTLRFEYQNFSKCYAGDSPRTPDGKKANFSLELVYELKSDNFTRFTDLPFYIDVEDSQEGFKTKKEMCVYVEEWICLNFFNSINEVKP